jgi:catechol 2,3-dioxygenase-like lactoylglutathione lyase family enzyme
MAKVTGLGGVFFRADDPEGLGRWYAEWLGLPVEHPYGASLPHVGLSGAGFSVWSPFPRDTTYFGPGDQSFMINLIVDDLDEALTQVRQGGADVTTETEDGEYGRFGWFVDPAGNRVELWQPPA